MSAVVKPNQVKFDGALICAVVGLIAIGTIMVTSASVSIVEGEPLHYLVRHVGALSVGLLGLAIVAVVPTELWYRLNWLLVVAGLGSLVLVLLPVFGVAENGSRRWLLLGPITVQASEPARLFLLLYLAGYAVRRSTQLGESLNGLVKPLFVVGVAAVLLLLEPDFGATVVLGATALTVLFVGGARLRDLMLAMLVGGGVLTALAFSADYRVVRLMSFRNPWADPLDTGFQLTQALMAIGRGEWGGVGLGESVQKLFYLPEAHTDFVFAVLVEELGFAGATLVIALFGIVVYRAITLGRAAIESGMHFQGLVATGIGVMLGFEAFINIGVNVGALPTKGLPLPLISYGRNSTVVTLVALGFLLRIHHELYGGQKRLVQRGYVR
ncbi:MAG TPA: putative lipid II flippase FtsW [Gammaproteobacteria bacterium]|nr:putative lipid II flippase FtsW [Gammaproteobacteria bacterium]